MSLWDGSEDEKQAFKLNKEPTMAKSHDLEHIPDEELQGELNRRKAQARCKEIQKREDIGAVLRRACAEIEGFRSLLIPNIKSELHTAVYEGSLDYEVTLTCFHNPLNEDEH